MNASMVVVDSSKAAMDTTGHHGCIHDYHGYITSYHGCIHNNNNLHEGVSAGCMQKHACLHFSLQEPRILGPGRSVEQSHTLLAPTCRASYLDGL